MLKQVRLTTVNLIIGALIPLILLIPQNSLASAKGVPGGSLDGAPKASREVHPDSPQVNEHDQTPRIFQTGTVGNPFAPSADPDLDDTGSSGPVGLSGLPPQGSAGQVERRPDETVFTRRG
ncbi:MAG: hypothetical protein LBC25_02055 [Holosporales bacterium]|jgi:hypothetical protein|nr:hypothetical protein [Holosporales bacterium]